MILFEPRFKAKEFYVAGLICASKLGSYWLIMDEHAVALYYLFFKYEIWKEKMKAKYIYCCYSSHTSSKCLSFKLLELIFLVDTYRLFNKFIVLLFNLIDIYESLNTVVNVEGVGMMKPWSLILTEVEKRSSDSE